MSQISRPELQESEFDYKRATRMTGWKQQPYQQTKNYVGKDGFSENWTHPIRMAGEIWSNPKAYSRKKEDQPHYNKVTGEIEGRVPVVPHQLDPGYGKALKDKEFIDEKGYSRLHDSNIRDKNIKKNMALFMSLLGQ